MDFLKDYFTWNGRWGRLKFWFLPLISLFLFVLPILGTIAFISLQGYSQDAKNSKVYSDINTISKKITIENIKGTDINSFILDDNKIDTSKLGDDMYNYNSPYENSEYKLFINDNYFLVYGELVNSEGKYEVKILGNAPVQEIEIDGVTLKSGDIINDREPIGASSGNMSETFGLIAVLVGVLGYITFLYISYAAYMKRLHDLGQSGWLALLSFVPFVNIGLLIYCGFFPGDKEDNKYGKVNGNGPERIMNPEL